MVVVKVSASYMRIGQCNEYDYAISDGSIVELEIKNAGVGIGSRLSMHEGIERMSIQKMDRIYTEGESTG
ncbi:MAG: hypothetical protein Tsb0034_27210 [Ekhidna sp.]